MLLASNLPSAKALLKQFAEEDDASMAKKIDWSEHDFRPEAHSVEEMDDMLDGLRTVGFNLSDMGG